MFSRGRILYPERASQLQDFSELRYANNITPTNIDLYLEFGNRASVFGELKLKDVQITYGQKLAMERLVDDCEKAGKQAIGFIAEHTTPIGQMIPTAQCEVIEYRWHRQWKTIEAITVGDFIDRWLQEMGLRRYVPLHRLH